MSDLSTSLLEADKLGVIAITFLVGFSGSIHCIGMCGAFASTCASKNSSLVFYHMGRIISYTTLGFIAGLAGSTFTQFFQDPLIQLIPSFILGLGFIIFGLRAFRSGKLQLRGPLFFQKSVNKVYSLFFKTKNLLLRSFLIGISSSLLPCGLLYGVLIALTTFQNPTTGAIGMASFCLGTIPALLVAPSIIVKILQPIKKRWPQIVATATTSLGLFIITYRLVGVYEKTFCH